MTKHVEERANRYTEELRKRHPGLTVDMIDGQSLWVDARLQVNCLSHKQVGQVLETVAKLTTKFYIDEGVYITASASFSSPM